MQEHEQIGIKVLEGATVVELRGQFLGGDETDALRDRLQGLADGRVRVLLDMKLVTFVNSSFLSALLAAHTHANRRGTSLTIVDMQETVSDILSLTGMDQVLNVAPDRETALNSDTRSIL